jgi:uncharacterized damage-inducible protein DinB
VALHPWFERQFAFDLPIGMAPNLLERLRGTPGRLEERTRGLPSLVLTRRSADRWSIQENVGHLGDLEPLWLGRVDDLAAGRPALRAADLDNRRTHQANHNARALADLLAGFREARGVLVNRLEAADHRSWARSALHPRLQAPMRLLDLAFFVCEHDDHHLARITELLREQ